VRGLAQSLTTHQPCTRAPLRQLPHATIHRPHPPRTVPHDTPAAAMGSLTWTRKDIPDLQGKVYIITGGNSGLVGAGRVLCGGPARTPPVLCRWHPQPCMPCAPHGRPRTHAPPPCRSTLRRAQGYEAALELARRNAHVIVATHAQRADAPMPADEIDGPGCVRRLAASVVAAAARQRQPSAVLCRAAASRSARRTTSGAAGAGSKRCVVAAWA
jgi:hypothetical protein